MIELSPAIQSQRLRRLLRRLIDIYSPSGKEEEILDFLYGYLRKYGLPVVRQPVDEHRYNLVVVPSGSDVRFAFIGHVDTVAAYDFEQYGYRQQGDLVSGLGATDMKGGCSAIVEAYVSLWQAGASQLPVALALVVGEEEEGDGAERLAEDYHFPWAIIAEPTDLSPCLSHYGYLEIQLCARGRRLHASLANRNQNPVEGMLHLLLKISHYMVNERPDGVYNIRDLLSTQAGFAVPEWCEAWLDIHLPPHAPIGEISHDLEDIVEQSRGEGSQIDSTMRLTTIHAGYELPEKGPVVEALRAVYNKHVLPWIPRAFPSHSDAPQLWTSGMKPVLLGPGQLAKAHAPDECVSFQQVLLAARLYRDLMVAMLP
ncbi:MAG: M20 family metallopeptidase [Syntrophobacteria bacterium]